MHASLDLQNCFCPACDSLVSTCQCVFGTEIFSSVSEERNKNAEGLNNKATELLVCPGGRGRYRGILSLKKPLQSANGVTKDSVGKALLLSVNTELVLETCAAATRRRWAGPKHNILCILALVSCHASSSMSSFFVFSLVSLSVSCCWLSPFILFIPHPLFSDFPPSEQYITPSYSTSSHSCLLSSFLQIPLEFLSHPHSYRLSFHRGSRSQCRCGPLPLNLPWPPGSGGRMLSLQPCERLLLAYNPVVGSGTEQKST